MLSNFIYISQPRDICDTISHPLCTGQSYKPLLFHTNYLPVYINSQLLPNLCCITHVKHKQVIIIIIIFVLRPFIPVTELDGLGVSPTLFCCKQFLL